MNFDIETNIVYIELTKAPIVNTVEFGNFIIHLSKNNTPALIEVLNASNFKKQLSLTSKITDINSILSTKAVPLKKQAD